MKEAEKGWVCPDCRKALRLEKYEDHDCVPGVPDLYETEEFLDAATEGAISGVSKVIRKIKGK